MFDHPVDGLKWAFSAVLAALNFFRPLPVRFSAVFLPTPFFL